jgi:hypothetical protein
LKTLFTGAALGADCAEVTTEIDPASKTNEQIPGLWLIRFADDGKREDIQIAANKLRPESFARWRPFQIGDVWWHELRLIQAPLGFNENPAERVLAPAPSVVELRPGGDPDNLSEADVNEIQVLTVPVNTGGFRGTYVLRWNGRTSSVLGVQDGAAQIAAALNSMWKDGQTRFKASVPETDKVWLEFIGPLKDTDWSEQLITPIVQTFRPGKLTFSLSLNHAQMHTALRTVASIDAPLEIELELLTDEQWAMDPKPPGRILTIAEQTVTITRELIWPEIAVVSVPKWLRPPVPRNHTRFNDSQVIVGNQATYVQPIGDGAAHSFSIPHGRGTYLGTVDLWETGAGGRLLPRDEFTLRKGEDENNEFILDFPEELEPPAENAYVFCFTASGPASAFMEGLHISEDQVDHLDDDLAALSARIGATEDVLGLGGTPGSGVPPTIDASGSIELVTIRDFSLTVPRPTFIAQDGTASVSATVVESSGTDAENKTTQSYTAPHDITTTGQQIRYSPLSVFLSATVEGTPKSNTTLYPNPAEDGKVYLVSGSGVVIAGRAGRPRQSLLDGSHVAHANGHWYPVIQGQTGKWWPLEAEQVMLDQPISGESFPIGTRWTFLWQLGVQLASREKFNGRIDYVAEAAALSSSFGKDSDLNSLSWTSLLVHTREFGDSLVQFKGSLVLDRTADATFAATTTLGLKTATVTSLTSPNLIVRLRSEHFDVDASEPAPRGALTLTLTGAQAALTKITT